MKKLYDLHMLEGRKFLEQLNEFNLLFSQLVSQGLNLDDEVKAVLLLCSLSSSWDMFCTAINTSALGGTLDYNDVVSSLLSEEIHRKSHDAMKSSADANLAVVKKIHSCHRSQY